MWELWRATYVHELPKAAKADQRREIKQTAEGKERLKNWDRIFLSSWWLSSSWFQVLMNRLSFDSCKIHSLLQINSLFFPLCSSLFEVSFNHLKSKECGLRQWPFMAQIPQVIGSLSGTSGLMCLLTSVLMVQSCPTTHMICFNSRISQPIRETSIC